MIEPMSQEVLQQQELVPQALVVVPDGTRRPPFVNFETGHDDLAGFRAAPLMLDGKLPFALFRYDTAPRGEFEIRLPETVTLDQVQKIVEMILAELDLPPTVVTWRRISTETPF